MRERANPTVNPGWSIKFKSNRPPPPFNQGVSVLDATPAQLELVNRELAHLVQAGACEPSTCTDYVFRLFLVPKRGNNQWRTMYDLRPLNKHYVRKRLKMETFLGVKQITRKGGYMFSFYLQDGFYAQGINPAADRY
jgi:hypothetical protein